MKKLARKWRNSEDDKFSLPTHDNEPSRPLDSQEQEELIRSLERSQAQQSRLWRTVFATLFFCYSMFLLYSIFQQASSPWELRYHAYFMEEIHSWMIISADWVAVLACSFAIIGLLQESMHHRRWMQHSCYTGSILAIFWLYYMLRLPKFRWDVIWLPFGPLCGAAICLYVDHILTESSEEIDPEILMSHQHVTEMISCMDSPTVIRFCFGWIKAVGEDKNSHRIADQLIGVEMAFGEKGIVLVRMG